MPVACAAKNLPVLLLYQVEPDWSQPDVEEARATHLRMVAALRQAGHPVSIAELTDSNLADLLARHAAEGRLLFNQCECLPGIPHSEYEAANLIEASGLIYTGSTADTLQLAEDKARSKELLEALKLPTPAWRVYEEPTADDWDIFPAIVKTTHEHCSLGLNAESVVTNKRELRARIRYILKYFKQPALVEDFIDGREFHVPVWGNQSPALLPVVEMDFSAFHDLHDRLCTYESKFIPDSKHYQAIESRIPAPLSAAELGEMERICLDVYRAFGCRDYARLDIRLRNGVFYVLDVNPNADLDSEASIACAAEHVGISYGDLLSRLVRLAAARHPRYAERRRGRRP